MRRIVLDTETTGLEPSEGHRVIEIACVELFDRRPTGRNFHRYLNPGREIDPGAVAIHGLTTDFLADKPRFADVADEFIEFVEGAELLIHNAAFDVGFLNAELKRLGRPLFHTVAAKVTDTLLMARELFPGKANGLDALCKRLEVDNTHRSFHGALLDAGLLAEVYIRLTRGQDSLVIQADEARPGQALAVPQLDLSSFQLPVIAPDADDIAAHDAVLKDLDKASGGKTVWRTLAA